MRLRRSVAAKSPLKSLTDSAKIVRQVPLDSLTGVPVVQQDLLLIASIYKNALRLKLVKTKNIKPKVLIAGTNRQKRSKAIISRSQILFLPSPNSRTPYEMPPADQQILSEIELSCAPLTATKSTCEPPTDSYLIPTHPRK